MTDEELLRLIEQAAADGREELDLHSKGLRSLPSKIGKLKQLRSLNIIHNPLKSLPIEIGQLTNLRSLSLSDDQLNILPGGIGQFVNLTSLSFLGNRLPREIFQLTNLRSLNLDGSQLSSLPMEIGQLTRLESLNLSFNQLSSLPEEIGQLTNLRSLSLRGNNLNHLPSEIFQLTDLQSLDISRNNLSSLPVEIVQLTNLKVIYLRDNPLESLPPESRHWTGTEILNFYRQQLEQETDRIYEAKLIIIGEPGAGKTSLAKKIQNPDYILQPSETSTEGIDIIQFSFPQDQTKDFRVNIWDFGGQEIYHSTHQFFLTKRSLYILVADTRKEDTDFYYWLNVVELLSDGSPVMIVKNEKQDRQREINEKQLRGEFIQLKETLETNLEHNRGLPKILETLKHHLQQLPHVGTELPKSWLKVRAALEEDPRHYITLEEYLQICQSNGFQRRKDKLQLSGYLHDLGVCLHFQDDDLLRKTVILKPTWGTDAVYKVLDNLQVRRNWGHFDRTDLSSIWHEEKYATMHPELLQLMKNFKLCYEIPGRRNSFIAPHLLAANQPDYDWDDSDNLHLRYDYDFMPKGILTRFIVELHHLVENQTLVWKNGVILSNDRARAEIIEYYRSSSGEIRIRVSGNGRKDLLNIIHYEFEKIHRSYERLKYNILIPCNCDRCSTDKPHKYTLTELHRYLDRQRPTIECRESFKQVNIRRLIDDVLPHIDKTRKANPPNPTRNRVFISYSHRDKSALEQLRTHLKPLILSGKLQTWDDTQIQAGTEWRREIETAIAAAKVAVLLVSPDFLASDFIADHELPPFLEVAETEGLTILWVPYRPSGYEGTAIHKYQAAHDPKRPIAALPNAEQDEAWVEICRKIQRAIEDTPGV
jgi:internalin A